MTLVIAHKLNNTISLSSDSRITFTGVGFVDMGIKVLSIPVKIYSPTAQESGITTLDYDYTLGIAIAGSSTNATIVKESIYEILQHLQYLPGSTDFSMNGIAKLVFKVYKKVSLELCDVIGSVGISKIILGGYCPVLDRIQVFEYGVNVTTGSPMIPYHKEILATDGDEFYGSGSAVAKRIYTAGVIRQPLHIIREVIKGGTVPSVGGGLQYGEFDKDTHNFKIYGVQDYKLYPNGTFEKYFDTLRGLNIYEGELEREDDDFHISYTMKQPFQQEVNDMLNKLIDGV